MSGELNFDGENNIAMGAGFIASFIAGLVACTWMITLVRKSKLSYFAIYCLIVGLISIIYGFTYT
jgi:undecaprenyl-diphosphatase